MRKTTISRSRQPSLPEIAEPYVAVINIPVTATELVRLTKYATAYGSGGFQNFVRKLVERSTITTTTK